MSKVVTTALSLRNFSCGTIVDITALKEQGQYELTCAIVAGGKTTIKYRLDASTGQASELIDFGQ